MQRRAALPEKFDLDKGDRLVGVRVSYFVLRADRPRVAFACSQLCGRTLSGGIGDVHGCCDEGHDDVGVVVSVNRDGTAGVDGPFGDAEVISGSLDFAV